MAFVPAKKGSSSLPSMTANRGSNAEKSAAQLAAQLAVRSRLEEVIHRNKVVGKKCFRLTPERRKKLTALLVEHAAAVIKQNEEEKAQERRRFIADIIQAQDHHSHITDLEELRIICRTYHDRLRILEDAKYELELLAQKRDYQLNEQTIKVNQLRGKFVRPALKSVASTATLERKSSVKKTENNAVARGFRDNLKEKAFRNTSENMMAQLEEAGWRSEKNKPDWLRQMSRKSDFDDISE